MAALGLGTYGAHGFKPTNPSYKEVWNTASLYHLVHTAALVGAPMAKNPNISIATSRLYGVGSTRGVPSSSVRV
ncbi:hypothetical protein HanLR1_Chr10g0371031 [Helianthus annuus]|nr:hypothetical protein HanLR1_Chr10g0371031 [Helianthus annuus]